MVPRTLRPTENFLSKYFLTVNPNQMARQIAKRIGDGTGNQSRARIGHDVGIGLKLTVHHIIDLSETFTAIGFQSVLRLSESFSCYMSYWTVKDADRAF
jgi:hypothetical protein